MDFMADGNFKAFEMDLVERWWHHLGDNIELLTEDDVLDIWMLRGPMEWTGTRVVELIDWRRSNGAD